MRQYVKSMMSDRISRAQGTGSQLPSPGEFGWRIDNPPGNLSVFYLLDASISQEHFIASVPRSKLQDGNRLWVFPEDPDEIVGLDNVPQLDFIRRHPAALETQIEGEVTVAACSRL